MGKTRERLSILLLQVRDDAEERRFEAASFARATGLAPERLVAVDVINTPPMPAMLDRTDAVIIGGSKYSVFDEVPNLAALIEVVKIARERKIPTLGSCFGAQLLAHAFGGEVQRDAEHEEWGTYVIQGSEDAWTDMLFADAPDAFPAQCSHHDRIVRLPPGATLLASSERCPVQAFSLPGDIYGFQFHAERSKDDFEKLVAMKKDEVGAGGTTKGLSPIQETPAAEQLVTKFIDRIVLAR